MVTAACASSKKSTKYSGFGLESLTAEQLKTFAPPPPQPELKAIIEKLVDIRSTSAGIITDDGKTLFTGWNVTGSNQIWKLAGPKSFPQQMTGGEDATQLVSLSPNNQWLVVSRDSKGDENHGIYLLNAKTGGALKKVYYNPKHQTSFLDFSDDSRFIYFRTNDKTPNSYSIYKYNIGTGEQEAIIDEPGIWSLSDIKGDQAILTLYKGSMNNEHYLLDLKTKAKTPLIGQNESEDFNVSFTNNKNEYLVLTNKISDFRRLYSLKDGKLTPFTAELQADVSGYRLSHNRKYVAYSVNDKGYSKPKVVVFASKKEIALPKIGSAEQVYMGSFSKNNRYLTIAAEYYDYPRRNFVFDLNSRRLTEWVTPSTPEVDTKNFVRPVLEYYKAADGTDIPMFVWRPEKCKNEVCPVIANFHGGPESQFTPRFNPTVNLYTEKGFVYVAPNVRGSDGYGKKWLQADNGVKRLDVITDIRDCADFIKKNWKKGDKIPKVGIMGGSYGGYSTLVGMSMFADSFDAGSAIVGMSSLITFIENTAPYRRALRMNEYGDPEKDRESMLKLSPATYVDKVVKPLLILHGATDPRVPVGEAVQFYETVKTKNENSKLVIFPDEGHGVAKRPNVVLLNSYVIDFFEKHLK